MVTGCMLARGCQRYRGAWTRWGGGFASALWLGLSSPALAQRLDVHVAGACPNRAALQQALEPLVDTPVSTVTDTPAAPDPERVAQVEDAGDRYRVVVGAAARTIDDAARDCRARARVAAVFIALNRPPPASAPFATAPSQGLRFGLSALVGASWQGSAGRPSPGVGLSGWLAVDGLRGAVELSAYLPEPIGQTTTGPAGQTPRAELLRVPLAIEAAYTWSLAPLSIGPLAGVSLDGYSLRVEGVDEPEQAFRVSPGIRLGLLLELALGGPFQLSLRTGGQLYPRPYRLRIAPEASLGRTPSVLAFALLGLGIALP